MLGVRCKIYYKGIEIERKESKYIKKELDRRKVERGNIGKKVIRIDKKMSVIGQFCKSNPLLGTCILKWINSISTFFLQKSVISF